MCMCHNHSFKVQWEPKIWGNLPVPGAIMKGFRENMIFELDHEIWMWFFQFTLSPSFIHMPKIQSKEEVLTKYLWDLDSPPFQILASLISFKQENRWWQGHTWGSKSSRGIQAKTMTGEDSTKCHCPHGGLSSFCSHLEIGSIDRGEQVWEIYGPRGRVENNQHYKRKTGNT